MSLIAVITDPAEVRKILRHLLKIGRAPPGLDPKDGGVFLEQATGRGSSLEMLTAARRP